MGDVTRFEFQREVACESGIREDLQSGAEIDCAPADRDIDVARGGVTNVDVLDAGREPGYELGGSPPDATTWLKSMTTPTSTGRRSVSSCARSRLKHRR